MVRYKPLSGLGKLEPFAEKYLGDKVDRIRDIAHAFKSLTTDQSEIIATLYACWNDFLVRKRAPTDDEIMSEFLLHWHTKKSRFSRGRLSKALAWMRKQGLVPKGVGKLTNTKALH
jgi:hypothetical protein